MIERRSLLPALPSIRPWLLEAGIVLWAVVTTPFAVFMATEGMRPWALAAIAAGPAAMLLRKRPYLAATLLIAGATVLRASFIGYSSSDPIALSQLAAERAFSGLNPYGVDYATGSPYAYGPLALVTNQAGILGEFAATVGTSFLLVWARAWMTLAFFNSWPQFLYTPVIGDNDYSAGFVLAAAIVGLRYRPRIGMALLAVAVAIKPYAAAWFLPALGFVGWGGAAIVGTLTLLVLWSPVLLLWGPQSYLGSVTRVESLRSGLVTMFPSWSFFDAPILRWLVVPFSIAGLVWRSWRAMVLLGAAGFLAFLGFSPWAHAAYLGAVVPLLGIAIEGYRTESPSRWELSDR